MTTNQGSSSGTGGPVGDRTRVTWSRALQGGAIAGTGNLRTDYTDMGGWVIVRSTPLATTATNPSIYQDVTFTFNRSVSGVEFSISDLDTFGGFGNHTYWDRVAVVSPSTYASSAVQVGNPNLTGTGTLADPFRQTTFTDAASSPENAVGRQMRVKLTAATTSFTLRFWTSRSNNNNGDHAVFIGDMSFLHGC